jgi:hypothetical protein
MGGTDTIKIIQIFCKICHRFKTNNQNISKIATVKRMEINNLDPLRPDRIHIEYIFHGFKKSIEK